MLIGFLNGAEAPFGLSGDGFVFGAVCKLWVSVGEVGHFFCVHHRAALGGLVEHGAVKGCCVSSLEFVVGHFVCFVHNVFLKKTLRDCLGLAEL